VRLEGVEAAAIGQAAQALAAGELVVFPTETVYGLGARADQDAAVAKIFHTKGRPSNHPLIVHIASPAQVPLFATHAPEVAWRLMSAFWPGPLTVILPRTTHMATAAAGGQSSIGLRCPSQPVAQALLAAALQRGVPGVAAPSANRFGRISPTTLEHVMQELGNDLLMLDGGACAVGIESTIIDCTRSQPVLLRPGVLTRALLEATAGQPLLAPDAQAPRASGTLAAHYAPSAKLRLMPHAMLNTALQMLAQETPNPVAQALKLAVYSFALLPQGLRGVQHRFMPTQAAQAAHELFAVLHELDADGVQLIWVEEPPLTAEWDGVRDRLQRAAASAVAT
jgi:L-threonylcarbamoyladenylate synthase